MQLTSQLTNNFTFNVITYQGLLIQDSHNQWVVDSGCTHHMDKYTSLFSSLEFTLKNNIFVRKNFSLDISGHGDVSCWSVPCAKSEWKSMSVSQLTHTLNIVQLFPNRFFIKNMKDKSVIIYGLPDRKYWLNKFCYLPQP